MYRITLTLAAAETLEATEDKLLGYPSRGVHVGGGRHVDMPATWDRTGRVPLGWTSYKGSTRQHPTLSQWATPLDAECPAAMANGRRTRLTAGEQTQMTADLAAAVPTLPGDWGLGVAGARADEGRRT